MLNNKSTLEAWQELRNFWRRSRLLAPSCAMKLSNCSLFTRLMGRFPTANIKENRIYMSVYARKKVHISELGQIYMATD